MSMNIGVFMVTWHHPYLLRLFEISYVFPLFTGLITLFVFKNFKKGILISNLIVDSYDELQVVLRLIRKQSVII